MEMSGSGHSGVGSGIGLCVWFTRGGLSLGRLLYPARTIFPGALPQVEIQAAAFAFGAETLVVRLGRRWVQRWRAVEAVGR